MSEDLDDHTILHEASHAWFNGDADRRALDRRGPRRGLRRRASASSSACRTSSSPIADRARARTGAFPLERLAGPGAHRRRRDRRAGAVRLRRGVHGRSGAIAEDIGDDGMRAVLGAADARARTRTPATAAAEKTGARRTGGGSSTSSRRSATRDDGRRPVPDVGRAAGANATRCDTREAARDAYAELDAAGGDVGGAARHPGEHGPVAVRRGDRAHGRAPSRCSSCATTSRPRRPSSALQPPADLEAPFEAADMAGRPRRRRRDARGADRCRGRGRRLARDALAAERTPLVGARAGRRDPGDRLRGGADRLRGGRRGRLRPPASAATVALLAGAESVGDHAGAASSALIVRRDRAPAGRASRSCSAGAAGAVAGVERRRRTHRLHSPPRRSRGRRATRGAVDADRDRTRSRAGLMGIQRARPSHEILSGDSADVYFARADSILAAEGLDPVVTMEVFTRREAVLCGIDEAQEPARPRAGRRGPRGDDGRGARPTATASRRARSCCGSARAIASSACTRRRSSGCSPSRPAGRPPRARSSTSPRPSRSSASGPVTSTRTSPTCSTTRRSSAAASVPRRRPGRGWPASPRPARCPTRWC